MKRLKLWGSIAVLVLLMLRPECAVAAAQRSMRLWFTSVAPALFPFLVLMPMLTGPEACAMYRRMFSRIMSALFSLPGESAPAVIMGMIAGSPGGALAVRRVAAQTGMGRAAALRIAVSVSGVSPAFLIMGVGQGIYGSVRMGVQLAGIQLAVQLALLFLLRGAFADAKLQLRGPDEKQGQLQAIPSAVEGVLGVCGYMVFFSLIADAAASVLGRGAGDALLLAADLPSGLHRIASWQGPGRMLVQGACIGFGGLCIQAQNMNALHGMGLRWRDMIAVRSVAAALSALLSTALLHPYVPQKAVNMENPLASYAFSLLIAGLMLLPTMIYLSNKLFLNNRNFPESGK